MSPSQWFRSRFSSNSNSNSQLDQDSPVPTQMDQTSNTKPRIPEFLTDHPTVIEVFQSQGCNSCPPTNSLLLSKMAQNDHNTLILDYHVTYWDYLGWKDPFGVREADEYQRQYAYARGTSRVYTPQVVVNGIAEGVGNSKNSLEGLIKEGNQKGIQRKPWLLFSETDQGLIITDSSADSSSMRRQGRIIEVIYDPVPHDVYIPRGENAGRTLTQRNTVKSVIDLGTWVDGQGPIQLPRRDLSDGLQRVLIVQEGKGGPMIGVSLIHF